MFGFGINKMKNVFYFTADWCQPCKKVKPIVESMKKEGFQFQIIDVDSEESLVKQFNIKSVPTFILFDENKEINRVTGSKTREELENFVNDKKTTKENV
jgi:thioredoxin-like negative regulator of GroEL